MGVEREDPKEGVLSVLAEWEALSPPSSPASRCSSWAQRRAFPVSSHSFPDSAGGVGIVITKALAG